MPDLPCLWWCETGRTRPRLVVALDHPTACASPWENDFRWWQVGERWEVSVYGGGAGAELEI
jgi:hypothetical protein